MTQLAMVCRFCSDVAVACYLVPEGCSCFPDDRVQSLCAQHEAKASPIGDMIRVA